MIDLIGNMWYVICDKRRKGRRKEKCKMNVYNLGISLHHSSYLFNENNGAKHDY